MNTQKPENQIIRNKIAILVAFCMIAGIVWHSICLIEGEHYLKSVAVIQNNIHAHFGEIEKDNHFHFANEEKMQECHPQFSDDDAVVTKSANKIIEPFQGHQPSIATIIEWVLSHNSQAEINKQNLKYTPNNSLFNQKTQLLIYI
ncbi:MAG: hypothetical protein HOD92_15040 [Deltaproteobacteria bacterium]|jgi:hypothetical protein|nr:hypothetical protein [Deltaproteobacteria bacterium]MBT4525022.1 hypothetical protein [Deltaproteobacteria bacterium]